MNLIKYEESNEQQQQPAASAQTLEQFNKLLNEAPDAASVKINAAANNSKYLPISYVQMQLDEFFMGIWETENFTHSVIANEIVGHVTLKYFHPFAKVWVKREGAAAVMIQQSKGAELTDISKKFKNTLGKDYPHLLASCITSAARTIGKKFGRDLNRKEEDHYNTFYTDIANSEAVTGAIEWDKVTTMKDLLIIWNENKDLQNNKQFVKTFTYQKNKLKK